MAFSIVNQASTYPVVLWIFLSLSVLNCPSSLQIVEAGRQYVLLSVRSLPCRQDIFSHIETEDDLSSHATLMKFPGITFLIGNLLKREID